MRSVKGSVGSVREIAYECRIVAQRDESALAGTGVESVVSHDVSEQDPSEAPEALEDFDLDDAVIRSNDSPDQLAQRFERDVWPLFNEMRGWALRFTGGHAHDADELLQVTMIRALTNFDKFREGTNLKGWLRTIMRNCFINETRRVKRSNMSDIDLTEPGYEKLATRSHGSILASAEDEYMSSIADPHLQRALASLPASQRRAVILADVDGLPYAEIADEMKSPIGTVMSRLHRGRARLREALLEAREESEDES